MHPTHLLARAASMSLLALVAVGCGDDEVDGQGGGAGSTTSASSAASTTGSSSASTPASASSGSVGSGGDGGEAGTGGAGGEAGTGGTGGAGGAQGTGGSGTGGAGGSCAEQPDPYEIGDDTEDACADFGADPDAPLFHVEFIGEPTEVLAYDGSIAIDMAFNYVLALRLADLADFTLVESRCQQLAGDEEPTCFGGDPIDLSSLEDECSLRFSGRFGIDPSNVREGINTFDFTMTLTNGCAEVSDTFTLVVDYQEG